jgi:hypothetical protein
LVDGRRNRLDASGIVQADETGDRSRDEVEMTATPSPPWTSEENEELRALILNAKSVEAIAKKLNRTPSAIRRRASMLKLPLKKIVQR